MTVRGRDPGPGRRVGPGLVRVVPGWATIRHYRRAWLGPDLVAGVVLATLLVPQGMAYAELAGLPAVTGLTTTAVALCAYAVFGPSRILVIGPDSALAPLILGTVAGVLAVGGPGDAVALAGMLAVLMGICSMVIGAVGLGTISELLSKPVRVGYLAGLAVIVLAGQLPKLFGFSASGDGFAGDLRAFADGVRAGATEPAALAIGVGCLATIVALARWRPAVPGVLVAVVAATAAVAVADLSDVVPVVGDVPAGLPSLTWPRVSWSQFETLVAAAIGITFVGLADTSALSRSLAARRGEQVDPDQEIAAIGVANVAAGLFGGFPVSASASRTAVAEAAGARTQLAGLVGAGGVLVVLGVATGLFRELPQSALAAIVVTAAFGLFDLRTMVWLWRVRPSEGILAVGALVGVVLLGPLVGIVVAVALAMADIVRRVRRPHDAVLGRIDGRKGYHDRARHPDAREVPGLVLYRFDGPLFFGNADHFRRRVLEVLDEHPRAQWFALSAEPVTDIDTTGAEALTALLDELDERGVRFVVAELKGPSKDRLVDYGLAERIGPGQRFPTLGLTVDAYLAATGTVWVDWTDRPAGEELDAS